MCCRVDAERESAGDRQPRPREMRAELSRVRESASTATLLAEEPPAEEKPYVGLRALMSGDDGKTTP